MRPEPTWEELEAKYEIIGDCYNCGRKLDPRYDYCCPMCERQNCDGCNEACIECDGITCSHCIPEHMRMAHPDSLEW